MSEQWTVFKLKFPKEQSKQFSKILSDANGNFNDGELFAHYGKLGDGIEAHLRSCAESGTDWHDDELTPEEALSPYEFDSSGRTATIEYMTVDNDKIEGFADVILETFELAGIEVKKAWIYNEDDLEEKEYLDLEPSNDDDFEMEEGGEAGLVITIQFPTDRASELTKLLWGSSKDETGPFAFHEDKQNTEVDILSVYDEISSELGSKIRALAETSPAWKNDGSTVEETLHFTQATTIGNDTSALVWLFDDENKIAPFQKEIQDIFSSAGLIIVPNDDAL
jgi:hypothetical protein